MGHHLLTILLWTGIAAYVLVVIAAVVAVVRQNRNPVKALAWITVLILFPAGGILLYLFVGQSRRNTRMLSRRKRRRLALAESNEPSRGNQTRLSPENTRLVKLIDSLVGSHFYTGNSVKIFHRGQSMFDAQFADLRQAVSYINIQYYIISDDALGQQLSDILVERAKAGVKVRLIYDYVGSFDTDRAYFDRMTKAGIEVHSFFRINFPRWATRVNWRNHRKVVIIDGKVGYIGGMNIATRYIDGGKKFEQWRDTAVRVTGPAVAGLQYNFAIDWSFMGQPLLTDPVDSTADSPDRSSMIQFVASGPTGRWSNMSMVYLKAIASARRRILLQTPYFLPTDGLLKALQAAALSGVDVRVMMPRHSDSAILTYASMSYIEACLMAGIKIYLYEGGMLHCKVLVVDDDFSMTGSSNFDFRSFDHNFEENILFYSPEENRALAGQFHLDMRESTRVRAPQWRHRPRSQKIKESVTRLLSPLL